MKTHIALALLALHLAISYAAPQNNVETEKADESSASVVADRRKGDASLLESYQNDRLIRTCANNVCTLITAGEAKALDYGTISGIFPMTGDEALTKALTPSVGIAMESVKALDDQRERLETLQKQMADLNSYFNKGVQAAAGMKGQFEASLMKGISLPAAPPMKAYAAAAPSKGTYAAAIPPSKGSYAAAPPSKGGMSAANSMQLEAAMCPMTMYELGKYQRKQAETDAQLQNSNSMNSLLMGEKRQLETEKSMLEMAKSRAEDQAMFNAKVAGEQKARADALEMALAKSNADNAALQLAKAELEATLKQTEDDLINEKATTAALTSALNSCNDDKEVLEAEKAALTNELKETKAELRDTQRNLEAEQNSHVRTQLKLEATQKELEATEARRQLLQQANEELEAELAETKDELATVTALRDELQRTLDATSALLSQCNEDKMKCNVELTQEKAENVALTNQLAETMKVLDAETKAREEITALLMDVKDTAEKLQQEVEKLQLENVYLRQQLMKLKAEQEAALAMAAGCPPTYEKFGISCYKYVREKTQWKMAQEQCMKDGGNLVSVETRQEQAFLVDYLKRHGAESDTYALTGGNKKMNHWKWLGSSEQYIGQTGPEYWFNQMTKSKPGYDCQAMYLRDASQYGKWVGMPCYSAAPFTCEYLIAPHGTAMPANPAESMAMHEMFSEAPSYLANSGITKGSYAFAPPSSKGVLSLAMASKGGY